MVPVAPKQLAGPTRIIQQKIHCDGILCTSRRISCVCCPAWKHRRLLQMYREKVSSHSHAGVSSTKFKMYNVLTLTVTAGKKYFP